VETVSLIRLTVKGYQVDFHYASRSEALGQPIRWILRTRDSRLPDVVFSLSVADCGQPIVEEALVLRVSGQVSTPGPFTVLACFATRDGEYELHLSQTVIAAKHLVPQRHCSVLEAGDLEGWVNSSPLCDFLSPGGPLASLNKLVVSRTVVMHLDQNSLELAAWLAWASSIGRPETPFFVIGDIGNSWRIVETPPASDDAGDPAELRPMDHWQVNSKPCPYQECAPFVSLAGSMRQYRFSNQVRSDAVSNCLSTPFLPKRLRVGNNAPLIIAKGDTFGLGAEAWVTQLTVGDSVPQPTWRPAEAVRIGRIMGTVAEEWNSGAVVESRVDDCPQRFPARLTTFDAGERGRVGWHWVPTKGNVIRLDHDFRLNSIPAIAYAERHSEPNDPYVMEIDGRQSWITRFGKTVVKLFKEGISVE